MAVVEGFVDHLHDGEDNCKYISDDKMKKKKLPSPPIQQAALITMDTAPRQHHRTRQHRTGGRGGIVTQGKGVSEVCGGNGFSPYNLIMSLSPPPFKNPQNCASYVNATRSDDGYEGEGRGWG